MGEVSGLEVINVIELDLIIKNGLLLICEIKSLMSKVEFYQKRHNKKAHRLLVISPMIEKKALELAKELGIQVYSYVEDIELDVFLNNP